MKRMTKSEVMAQISRLNDNLPPHVESERHLVRYLEKIIVALKPLTDHEPVDAVASKLLFEWTNLFTYQETDAQHLAGLPQLMLAMGAHLFHVNEKGKSTITQLPPLPSSAPPKHASDDTPLQDFTNTSYFFNEFFIPFCKQNLDVIVFMTCVGITNPRTLYTRYLTEKKLDKERIIQGIINPANSHLFLREKLAMTGPIPEETLLMHLLKIGSRSNTINPKAKHYIAARQLIGSCSINEKTLLTFLLDEKLIARKNYFSPSITTTSKGQPNALSNDERQTIFRLTDTLISEEKWDMLERLMDLGVPPNSLVVALRKTTQHALNTHDDNERNLAIAQIKAIIALGVCTIQNTNDTLSPLTLILQHLTTMTTYRRVETAFPKAVFEALYPCTLSDIKSASHLPLDVIIPLLMATLRVDATHHSRKALRVYYHEQLEKNRDISPLFAAIYCAANVRSEKRFFGLTQTTFKRLFVNETDEPLNFIYPLFKSMVSTIYRDASILTLFKDKLMSAIHALSPEAKDELRELMKTKKTCLVLDILKTRQNQDNKKNTKHHTQLTHELPPKSSDYTNHDSSDDDEAETLSPDWDDSEFSALEKGYAKLLKELKPPIALASMFYHDLVGKEANLYLLSATVKQKNFDLNESFNWIQLCLFDVVINNDTPGSILLKLWSDMHPATETTLEKKQALTQWLILHGLSIFNTLQAIKHFKCHSKNPEPLIECLEKIYETGMLEENFYKITPDHLNAQLGARHSNEEYKALFNKLLAMDRPSPITILMMSYVLNCSPELTANDLKKHFMQPMTKKQKQGLMHLLTSLAYIRGSNLAEVKAIILRCVDTSPALIEEFKRLKNEKTPCALFMILKHLPSHHTNAYNETTMHGSPYRANLYTLFKQKYWPKSAPAQLEAQSIMNQHAVMGLV